MALESLSEKFLQARLQTTAAGSRFKLLTANNAYTDVDAFAAAPQAGTLALAECKAQGGATQVYALSSGYSLFPGTYTEATLNLARNVFAPRNRWASTWFNFGSEPDVWQGLRLVELWLVANVYVAVEDQDAVDARFTNEILQQGIPGLPEGVEVRAYVRSSLDIILALLQSLEHTIVVDGWGARTGDPQLDLLRELIRYKHPFVSDAGNGASAACRRESAAKIRGYFPP